jgi:hypothetical protein
MTHPISNLPDDDEFDFEEDIDATPIDDDLNIFVASDDTVEECDLDVENLAYLSRRDAFLAEFRAIYGVELYAVEGLTLNEVRDVLKADDLKIKQAPSLAKMVDDERKIQRQQIALGRFLTSIEIFQIR